MQPERLQSNNLTAPSIPAAQTGPLLRACECGTHTAEATGECDGCRERRESAGLQRSAVAPGPAEAPPAVHDVLRAPGQPLDAATRAFMEPRFGRDFSQVRVHTDAQAAESAAAVNARAYTVGSDVVFGAGQYSPATAEGKRLVAHELTHVVQQGRGGPAPNLSSSAPYEQAARSAESAVAGHGTVPVHGATGIGLARAKKDEVQEGGFGEILKGALLGEFNEDPSFAEIGVDFGISLVPGLDQVADARDLSAHFYLMLAEEQYKSPSRWVGLVFSLIGLFPELGSVIKSASKFAIKGLKEGLRYLEPLLELIRKILPEFSNIGQIHRHIKIIWSDIVTNGKLAWYTFFEKASNIVMLVARFAGEAGQRTRNALAAIAEMAPKKIDEAFKWVRDKLDEFFTDLESRLDLQPQRMGTGAVQETPNTLLSQGAKSTEALPSRTTTTTTSELYPNKNSITKKTSAANLEPHQTTEYGRFNIRERLGDKLEGHEVLMNSWLKHHELIKDRGRGISRFNSAIALSSKEHELVTKFQR
jgi:hypothetical protein